MDLKKSIYSSAAFGGIAFVIAFGLGSILTYSTGVPLIGGLINGVFTAMILTIGMLVRKFKFSGTIMWLTFSLFATITTTLGPPGIYKVLIGLSAGFLWDLFYGILSNFKRWGLYVGGLIGSASIMLLMVLLLGLGFGKNSLEALEKYQDQLFILTTINLIITAVGIVLGKIVYHKRLSSLPQFKNLSSD